MATRWGAPPETTLFYRHSTPYGVAPNSWPSLSRTRVRQVLAGIGKAHPACAHRPNTRSLTQFNNLHWRQHLIGSKLAARRLAKGLVEPRFFFGEREAISMEGLIYDLRFAARVLRRRPAFGGAEIRVGVLSSKSVVSSSVARIRQTTC